MSAQSKPPPVCLANSASPECKAVLRLKLARGMSSSAWNAIRESFGGAAGALCASAAAWQAARLAPQLRDAALGVTQRALQGLLTQLSDAGAHVLIRNDAAYPHLLSHLSDAPPVLFVPGELKPQTTACVAIVGSRAATPTGHATARRFGETLVAQGCTLVSGLALGIDAAAHRDALRAVPVHGQLPQIAVAACGSDRVYPRAHERLAEEIVVSEGVILTEFSPGERPLAAHFPQRNRIISGICLGVVVVEAAERSGSLITARLAAEQGREVSAGPGAVVSAQSRGCHSLIRDSAMLVEDMAEVFSELKLESAFQSEMQPKTKGSVASSQRVEAPHELPGEPVYRMLQSGPMSVDDVAAALGVAPPEALSRLEKLALSGFVCGAVGGVGMFRFRACDRENRSS